MVSHPAFGPYDGLPELGDLDFTTEGGALWRRINRELFEQDETEHWTGRGDSDSMEWIATSESTIRRLIGEEECNSGREIVAVSEIVSVGPWRDRWWDVIYEQGFLATVTYRPEPEDA
jgi:hypothetical protein